MVELEGAHSTETADSEQIPSAIPSVNRGYTSVLAGAILIFSTLGTGALYVIFQWFRQKEVKDSVFVSMLIAATMILVFGVSKLSKYIINKGLNFCVFALSRSNSEKGYEYYERLCSSVLNSRRMTLSGLGYGVVIGSAPFVLGVWNNDLGLKMLLSLFMFSVNFVTGIAFYGLIVFFFHSIRMGEMVSVNLWQVNNPSTDFFLGTTRRVSILASVYISICLSSILFSLLPIGGFIMAYSCFAAFIIVASIAVPPLPVMRKLKEAKARAMLAIDQQLHLSFYKNLEDTEPNKPAVDFDKVKTLLELREKVEEINVWPFRVRSIMASLSVLVFSSVPVVLQIVLKRLFG